MFELFSDYLCFLYVFAFYIGSFFLLFLFTIVVCVAAKSACCTLFVLPVAVPVAYGVCVTGIAGLIILAVISILWPWVLVLVFCVIWVIRANVRVVHLILEISGI